MVRLTRSTIAITINLPNYHRIDMCQVWGVGIEKSRVDTILAQLLYSGISAKLVLRVTAVADNDTDNSKSYFCLMAARLVH